jgi:hypothetical protein
MRKICTYHYFFFVFLGGCICTPGPLLVALSLWRLHRFINWFHAYGWKRNPNGEYLQSLWYILAWDDEQMHLILYRVLANLV